MDMSFVWIEVRPGVLNVGRDTVTTQEQWSVRTHSDAKDVLN